MTFKDILDEELLVLIINETDEQDDVATEYSDQDNRTMSNRANTGTLTARKGTHLP